MAIPRRLILNSEWATLIAALIILRTDGTAIYRASFIILGVFKANYREIEIIAAVSQ